MALLKGHKHNFQQIKTAAENNNLALVECTEKATGKPVAVVCAVWVDKRKEYNFTPLARMFDDNPYEVLDPPWLKEESAMTECPECHKRSVRAKASGVACTSPGCGYCSCD